MIDEPSLSRLHARLAVDEHGRLTVEDLGSTNGIFINGEPQHTGRLAAGDHVRFGFLEYLVDAERDAPAVRADHTILRMPVPDNARAVASTSRFTSRMSWTIPIIADFST